MLSVKCQALNELSSTTKVSYRLTIFYRLKKCRFDPRPSKSILGPTPVVMARPFDDHTPLQYIGSSLSSQTSLPTTRVGTSHPPFRLPDDSAQTWNSRRAIVQSPHIKQGSRLAKIKSSPSNGALAAARKASSHGRLHKRGNSTSDSQSPASSSTFDTPYYPSGMGFATPPTARSDLYTLPSPSSVSKTKVMIKPFLRKLSNQEQTSIDLSRSAAENEGLGIYNSSEILPDVSGGQPYTEVGRGYHHRTTSGNSQMSTNTSSSLHRYPTHYVHPMRQTPRPYTPTIAASYQNSLESDTSAHVPNPASFEGTYSEPSHDASTTSYAPIPPSRRVPPPLYIGSSSLSHLASSSQSNLPGTPSSLRRQTDSISTPDIMLPTTRSSFDSAFRKRSRTNTQTDPITQAATVQALRQKFNEKEAAKDLKFQQAEARAHEKEARKREKREEDEKRKSEAKVGKERKRGKSNTPSEKSGFANVREHGNQDATGSFPAEPLTRPGLPHRGPTEKAGVARKVVRSQWSLFWFKFKTMWLKLKRKMSP